jgi:hypothetical protein
VIIGKDFEVHEGEMLTPNPVIRTLASSFGAFFSMVDGPGEKVLMMRREIKLSQTRMFGIC